ncbi:hypothetical protein ACZ90_18040 [Streptomyces albus subsp. albus]|nr:hypothetical protein ACZ90_18040 [Streptomyces albus subsp. albus]
MYDRDRHWGTTSLLLDALGDLDGNTAGGHCAFGWPDASYASQVTQRDADGPTVHPLRLAEDVELGWQQAAEELADRAPGDLLGITAHPFIAPSGGHPGLITHHPIHNP